MRNSWTKDAIMCYNRGCRCKGCYFENFFSEPLKCRMKYSVMNLVKILGKPSMNLEDKRQLRTQYINNIKALEFPKQNMLDFYVTYTFNGKYYKTRCVDDLELNLELCQREFNEEVLRIIRKHPIEFVNSKDLEVSLEEKIYKILDKLPTVDEIIEPYWCKYWKAVDLCYQYVDEKLKEK